MTLYADQAATSYPVLFPVNGAMAYANASSAHKLGRDAKDALAKARSRIAQSLGMPSVSSENLAKQIVFTSGGTESNNLVLQQSMWRFIITVPTEHHSVFFTAQYMGNNQSCDVVFLSVDGQGRLKDLNELRDLLKGRCGSGTGLISLAYVNNEVGTILDLVAVGRVIQSANESRSQTERVWFHSDLMQAPGHVPLNMGSNGALGAVDFLCLAAHKFHGPPGVGMVVCRAAGFLLHPLFYGGHQQAGVRPGTEPVGAIVAMAEAFEDANNTTKLAERTAHMRRLTSEIWSCLLPYIAAGVVLPTGCTNSGDRAPHHVSFCVHGAHRKELVSEMEQDSGVLVSSGSACSTDTSLPSHVLDAMGVPPKYIHGSLRISLTHLNTQEEVVNRICPGLVKVLEKRLVM